MCDVKKYDEIYQEILKLQPDDTLQGMPRVNTDEIVRELGDWRNI